MGSQRDSALELDQQVLSDSVDTLDPLPVARTMTSDLAKPHVGRDLPIEDRRK